MSEISWRKTIVCITAAVVLAGAAPRKASAQAWLPPKGEASFSVAGQYQGARYHTLWDGRLDDRGRMQWIHAISDLSYGVSDRFALRAGIPFVFSRYTGNFPHVPVGRPLHDDGAWHRTFQDLSLEARYMATTGALVITPFVAFAVPAAGYEQLSHAAAGRSLREYTAGANVGRRLDPLLPNGYAHAKVSFTVPERVLGIWHNRNNADLELGHMLSPSAGVIVLGSWQWTHGGFRIPLDAPPGSVNASVHDQLAKDSHFLVGAGITFAASGSLDLSATGVRMISGENSLLLRGLSIGATWSFSPARIFRRGKGRAPRVRPGPE